MSKRKPNRAKYSQYGNYGRHENVLFEGKGDSQVVMKAPPSKNDKDYSADVRNIKIRTMAERMKKNKGNQAEKNARRGFLSGE